MRSSRGKEEDDDFDPKLRKQSGLFTIFDRSSSPSRSNSSLSYTPQKQPKAQATTSSHQPTQPKPSSAPSSSSVLTAKTISSFKLVDQAYQNQGRMGVAIISTQHQENSYYQLVLYRDKKAYSCSTKIYPGFKYHVQPKNYCTFYDKDNIIWSILFDNRNDMEDFNLKLAVVRWKVEGSDQLLQQDLWCPTAVSGEDKKASLVAIGDSVSLSYTITTLAEPLISQTKEEVERIVVQVDNSRVKTCLVGLQHTSEKIIIAQPSILSEFLPKGKQHDSPLIMRLTVIQISKPQDVSKEVALQDEARSLSEVLTETISEPSVTESLPVEEIASPDKKSSKASLISRMAKMGQPLPFKTVAPTPSDSDDTEEDLCRRYKASQGQPKPRPRSQQTAMVPTTPVDTVATMSAPYSPSVSHQSVPLQWAAAPAPYMCSNMYAAGTQVQSPLESQAQFNMFFSEMRTTNSELRMGITRLTDKVESLQSKMDTSDKRPDQEILSVLEKLLNNEQEVKSQLQQITTALNRSPLSSQNVPSGDQRTNAATESCQRCCQLESVEAILREKVQENEDILARNEALKALQNNARLIEREQRGRLERLTASLEEEQKKVLNLNEKIRSLRETHDKEEENAALACELIEQLQSTLCEKQTCIDKLESALSNSEATKIEEVRRNLQDMIDPSTAVREHVKEIVNSVYKCAKIQFEPNKSYDTTSVLSILATTIKAVTMQYLDGNPSNGLMSSELTIPVQDAQSSSNVSTDQDDTGDQNELDAKESESTQSCDSGVNGFEESPSTLVHNDCDNKTGETSNLEKAVNGSKTSETKEEAGNSSHDTWKSQAPPPPLFDNNDEDNEDDWLA